MIRKSFTMRVLLVSFLCLALPLFVDAFVFFKKMYRDAIDNAKNDLRVAAQDRALTLFSVKPVGRVFLKEVAFTIDLPQALRHPDSIELTKKLNDVVPERGNYNISIMVMEKGGVYKIIASTDLEEIGKRFISYVLIDKAIAQEEGAFVRFTYSERERRYIPYIYIANLVTNQEGETIGIIMISANIESQMQNLIQEGVERKNVRFAILNTDGIIIAATDPRLRGNYFYALSEKRKQEIVSSGQITWERLAKNPLKVEKDPNDPFFEFLFNGEAQIGYHIAIPGEISLVSYSSKSIFFSRALKHFVTIYAIYALILLVGGAVTYWLALWISSPLRQLARCMMQVREGNLTARFQEESLGFEINLLGGRFNKTLDTLLENVQKAEDERVKKETYQKELSLARSVQQSLLPAQIPSMRALELAGAYLPAERVNGDYYDFLVKTSKEGAEVVVVTLADLQGSGFSSCLYAQALRGLLRTYASLYDDPATILERASHTRFMESMQRGSLTKGFFGFLNSDTKIMHYCNLSPHGGFLVRSGKMEKLEQTDIGLDLDAQQHKHFGFASLQLQSRDMVILYTEGLLGSKNERSELFGEERLRALLSHEPSLTANEQVDRIADAIKQFIAHAPVQEEIIIVAIKVS